MYDIFAIIIGLVASLVASIAYVYVIARKFVNYKFILRKNSINTVATIIAAMTAIIGITTVLFEGLQLPKSKMYLYNKYEISEMIKEFNVLEARLDSIKQRNFLIKLDSLQNHGIVSKEIVKLKKEIDLNKNKISKFENLLLTDAENLITLPLIKRDIEGLRSEISSIKNNINSQKSMIQEMQTQNRWIIGTLGLGILALLIPVIKSSFGSTNKQSDEAK